MKITASKLLATYVCTVALCGCASRRQLPIEAITFPAVGSTSTRNVGEALISHGYAKLIPKLIIPSDQKIGATDIPAGTYYFNAENSERFKFLLGSLEVYLYKDKKNICIAKDKCLDMPYSIENSLGAPMADHFQQTLIYNGKIGNKITLGYREFSGNVARPAFSNEVSYDLSESSVLGYKGARIEVIKATNTEVTYKIVSGFVQ
ncbi:hypothetical protein [Duganella sp. HH105]|uniref:hypothetical protein n=1 Tax=Duganella sp. HH105 TaxID=1781067 RepID=UPI000877BD94|nr:hypothetical protein [Duganella sp. HH105]OEZ64157.1 hypothetical protein DUGA6_06620 [Duganella sp. HH105]